jgi:DNA-binding response OmpR family regulator
MMHPQVLVYETDGRLAELIRQGGERDWTLREPRRLESCLEMLRRASPSALIVRTGMDLINEFALIERVAWLFPDTAIVAVGDSENSQLEALSWDLGAAYVLGAGQTRVLLGRVIDSLMNRSGARQIEATGVIDES